MLTLGEDSQLEAIIRISESLAKLTLATTVAEHHVDEAIRLFKFSTMDAVQAGNIEGMTRGELQEEMTKVEGDIRRRLPIGWSTSYASLVREFVSQQGYSQHALDRSLYILEKREVIRCVVLLSLVGFASWLIWVSIVQVRRPEEDGSARRRVMLS